MTKYKGKKVGVLLAGCGVYDGSEIHESVLTLLALDKAGVQIEYIAPDIAQFHVIDHGQSKEMEKENRNVLQESARIARQKVTNLKEVNIEELDGLVVPGGFGVAKNLCNFFSKGPNCEVNPDVKDFIEKMHAAKKPMGFMCISPAMAAKILGNGIKLTIGKDPGTAETIEKLGCKHIECTVEEIVVDEDHKIVTTPAYMLGPSISHVAIGIEKCVNKLLEMTL